MSLKLLLVLTGAAMLGLGAEATASSRPWVSLRLQQQTFRQQIRLYHSEHARFPWSTGEVARTQWRVLIEGGYLTGEGRNPLSPPKVATRIVEVTGAGDQGLSISPATAGWVWNSTDHEFYAAGLEASQTSVLAPPISITWRDLVCAGAIMLAPIILLPAAQRAMRRCVMQLWRLLPRRWQRIPKTTLRRLWCGFVGATLGGLVALVGGIVIHTLGSPALALGLLPVCVIPGFFLGLMFGDIGSADRSMGAHPPAQPGSILSPWAEAAFYAAFFCILIIPAPVPLALSVVAIYDVGRHPNRHGMVRAIFALAMALPFTLLLAALVFDFDLLPRCGPPCGE